MIVPRGQSPGLSGASVGPTLPNLQLPGANAYAKPITINRFLSYRFTQSILVPVDSWEFTTAIPGDTNPIKSYVNEGDTVILSANNETLATGVIDRIDIEFDRDEGEKVTISGRNLFAQYEDQDAISLDGQPQYADNYTPTQVIQQLNRDTIIPGFIFQQAPVKGYLFATEPGESKLQALTRYMDPLNCIAWMNPYGQIVFGRPNMAQAPSGIIAMLKAQRRANVVSIRASYNSTSIPNIIAAIWSAPNATAEAAVIASPPPNQIFYNAAVGPKVLRLKGYRLPKSVVISNPQSNSPQELPSVNAVTVAGGGNLLEAYAKRELARANVRELNVQAVMAGHFNDAGNPFQIDTTYSVKFDRGSVDETMYLYQLEHSMDPEKGQRTVLDFCRLGCIVSDIVAP